MKCVVRYSEIGLKSRQSRKSMERTLVRNIRECVGDVRVWSGNGRIIVDTGDADSLSRVFGLSSVSPAVEVKAGIDDIKKAALGLYTGGKFRVSCRRVTKDTRETSMEMMKEIGSYIVEEKGAEVDLENYDVDIGIEILRKRAYVFNRTVKGPAGLPLGTQGKVVMECDGLMAAAAYLVMKRGVEVVPVGEGNEVTNIIHERWAYGSSFEPVDGELAEVAREHGCLGIVVSRDMTLDELAHMKKSTGMLLLLPLLGYDNNEIKRITKLVTEK